MNPILSALKEVAAFLESRGWRYALIGGLAVGCRGRPRTTNDVDLSLWVEVGEEESVIDAVLKEFSPRISDAAEFALSVRILVIEAANKVPIDLALASFPFEWNMIDRATLEKIQAGLKVRVLSAEDLIVTKAMAGRPQDWIDVQGIFDRAGSKLDHAAIERQLNELAELINLNEVLPRLEACRQKAAE